MALTKIPAFHPVKDHLKSDYGKNIFGKLFSPQKTEFKQRSTIM